MVWTLYLALIFFFLDSREITSTTISSTSTTPGTEFINSTMMQFSFLIELEVFSHPINLKQIFLVGPCTKCITGGIFTVGGLHLGWITSPEFIDPYSSVPLCTDPSPFPSSQGIVDSVGTYIGNATVLICGGLRKYDGYFNKGSFITNQCERYVILVLG